MKKINEYIYEAIKDYEFLTAGRFYTNDQKMSILDLVSLSNLLTPQEQSFIKQEIFDGEMQAFVSIQDCANGLLLMSNLSEKDAKKIIVEKRLLTHKKLIKEVSWQSREQWLNHIGLNNDLISVLDLSILYFSVGKKEKALSKLAVLIEDNYPLAIKLAIAILVKGAKDSEIESLAKKYEHIMQQLYFTQSSPRFKSTYKLSENIDNCYENGQLNYFEQNKLYTRKIGFEVKNVKQ